MRTVTHLAILALSIALFAVPVKAEQYLTGRLLIAGDDMQDSRFHKTVILILEHDQSGALGVVLNRVIGTGPFGTLIAGLGIKPDMVDETALNKIVALRQGGPVDPNRVIVVHSTDFDDSGSRNLGSGVAWTSEQTVLQAAAAGHGPEHLMIFFAYAGWASGQLEAEFARGGWLDADTDARVIFDTPADELFDAVRDTGGLSL
jgi:putative transcriptional regulator